MSGSEASRAIVRMATNYLRLGLNLALGITLVRVLIGWVGADAMALILLIVAGAGFGMMFRELSNRAAVRELGAAHHSGDRERFLRVFNSARVVSGVAALLAGVAFAGLFLYLPHMKMPDSLRPAAPALVIGQGLYIVLATAFSPVFNMFSVAERFVAYNLWTLAERACQLTAALWLHHVTGVSSPPAGVFAYGYLVAGLQGAVFVVPVAWLMLSDPRLRPRPSKVGKSEIRELSRTLGWYFAVELGSSLHERVGALIMNAYFALLGSIVFGLALQFTSYVRLATQGVTFGLDAVSARISTEKNKSLSVLLTHSTRLHGLVAFPAGLVMAALAHPLIQLWVGGKPDITPEIIDRTALTVQIMSVALTSRAISDGWMMILYGAGFLRVYAPLVLVGAMFNPAITLGTLWSIPQGQIVQNVGFYANPIVFSAVYTTVHFVILPVVAARCLKVRYAEVFSPLARPLVATLATAALVGPLVWLGWRAYPHWNVWMIGASLALFAGVYGVVAALVVLSAKERERFIWPLMKRTGFGPRGA
ncbi:MAG: hypothetical protein IT434_05070 [Phycisphaerales bacterium]|nr:hypothetical protein [Phycisphaerales bacterium]